MAEKVAATTRQLRYLMPNARGPRQKSRRLLAIVTTSRILYDAFFWSGTMQKSGWKKMVAAHRRSQLRAAFCYSTVSHGCGIKYPAYKASGQFADGDAPRPQQERGQA